MTATPLPWWVIHSDDILAMLERAHDGDDPGAVLAEWYANSDHEHIRPAMVPDPNPMPVFRVLSWRKRR